MEPQKKEWLLPASILIAAVLISGSIFYLVQSNRANQAPSQNQSAGQTGQGAQVQTEVNKLGGRDTIMGDPNAPITVIEYADFQCPFCGRFFSAVEPQIRDQYVKTGKVKMVYRHFAFLDQFQGGKNESHLAAEASECAKDQGKFWQYHDAIYTAEIADGKENSGNLNRDLFLKLAKDTNMDVAAFTSCYDSSKYADAVKNETQTAASYGVDSTPTTFVNGKKVTDSKGNSAGANPSLIFQAIEAAIAGK